MRLSEVLLNNFLEYYKERLIDKNLKYAEQYRLFIINFVNEFDRDFYNLDIKSLFSLTEEETQIVRMRYGVYTNGKYCTLQKITDELGVKYPSNIISKFERRIFEELDHNISYYSLLLENNEYSDVFESDLLNIDKSSFVDSLFLKKCDLVVTQHSILQKRAKIDKLLKEIEKEEAKEASLLLEIDELVNKQSNIDKEI